MALLEVTPEQLAEVCGPDARVSCETVLRWTENETAAKIADWLADKPVKIAFIVAVAFVANRLLRRLIRKLVDNIASAEPTGASKALRDLRRVTPKALLSTAPEASLRSSMRARTIGSVLRSVTTAVVWGIATMLVLGEVGVDLAPLIAGAGVVGIALGFGAQSLVRDFLSGMFMLLEDQYGVGDVIDAGEASGVVEAVSLRSTRLRGVDGTVWHIPNGEIHRVGNMSQQWARALIDIEVAYDTDLDLAERIVLETANSLWDDDVWRAVILEAPEVWGIESLGRDGIAIRLVVKTQPGEQWRVMRELRRRVKDRFDGAGIEIPFPQRTLWVRRDPGTSVDRPGDHGDDPFD